MKDFYFYICTPGWKPHSAGVRSLHQLCHEINERGYLAFIPQGTRNLKLKTPYLADGFAAYDLSQMKKIVVYPESVKGNIWQGDVVARWLLNVQPHFEVDKSDVFFAFEPQYKVLGKDCRQLWMPMVDEGIFYDSNLPRSGRCIYINKYKGRVAPDHVKGSTDLSKITRGDKAALAEIFRSSEYLILYEESMVGMEAAFCGCPTVYVLSDQLKKVPGAMVGEIHGSTTGFDKKSIAHARETIPLMLAGYQRLKKETPTMIDEFIRLCIERLG
jgi:hypothetical protein